MDELDVIQRFRAGVPEATPHEVERALAGVLRGAGAAAPGRHRVRRRWLVAAAVPLAVLLLAGSLTVRGRVGVPAAEAALERAARTAAAQPGPGRLRPGQFWYVRSRRSELWPPATARPAWRLAPAPGTGATAARGVAGTSAWPPYQALWQSTREFWISADGSGRIRARRAGAPAFLDAGDRARWVAAGRPDLASRMDIGVGTEAGEHPDPRAGDNPDDRLSFGPVAGYQELLRLPTDPRALYQRFRARARGSARGVDLDTFQSIAELLGEAPTPPSLRAALYRAAALVPGVRLLPDVTDPVGRPGTAVVMVGEDGVQSELIFDPGTATPLAERRVLTRRIEGVAAAPGAVVGEVVYLARGVVASTRATAAGR